jgi:eukaryotic-like serine/threonine-protein kinase
MNDGPNLNYEGMIVAQRYRVERMIGVGGMGTVWAGRHLSLERLVAIKFIHPKLATSAEALRRFDLEAKAAAKLKSRHAVAVHDHGVTSDGQPYIVMEYLEGETLERAIRRRGPLPLAEVTAIVTQAARALQAAHDAGIIHRDLKPDNIFLMNDAEAGKLGYTVKLVDFGIAKMLQDDAAHGAAATQAGSVLGTPHYMSPETLTAFAPVSAASDIWSLGACTFTASVGRLPFEGDAIGDVVLKVCAAPLPVPSKLNPSLPEAFDEWFAKACHRDRSQRFGSVRELAIALQQLDQWLARRRQASAYELKPSAPASIITLPPPRSTNKAFVLAGVLAGIAVTLGAVGLYVANLKHEANEAITRTAASAAAAVESENDKQLRAAEQRFWPSVQDAGADAPADAGRSRRR